MIFGWYSMDTAPKDGTPVPLFARAKHATAEVPLIGWWSEGDQEWIELCFSPSSPVGVVPSQWMPRPAFPVVSA